jgi:hypothetical protein
MGMSYIVQKKNKNRRRNRLIPCLVGLLVIWGCLDHATAQNRNNQSDWNVPPPLAPGTITKGNTPRNGLAGKPIVLTLTDIPAVAQPFVSATQAPVLAAIGSTPPAIDAPDQPGFNGAGAGLSEIPLPEAPETPHLPKQTIHDLQFSSVMDLPLPESPELPQAPVEPIVSGQVNIIKGPIPVMPDITGTVPLLQPSGDLMPWSIPEIPESENFKMVSPPGAKDDKLKGKSQSNRKKH